MPGVANLVVCATYDCSLCVCVCVHAWVSACVHACMCVCMCGWVGGCLCVCCKGSPLELTEGYTQITDGKEMMQRDVNEYTLHWTTRQDKTNPQQKLQNKQ